MADGEYIIKTKYRELFDFVFLKQDQMSYENFVIEGKSN